MHVFSLNLPRFLYRLPEYGVLWGLMLPPNLGLGTRDGNLKDFDIFDRDLQVVS